VQHILYAIGGESTTAPPSAAWAQNARDLSRLGTADMLQAIRADGVDVLIDLVGRAAGNRVALFAARAAPVQVGWLDVFYPSGLDAMDFLISDPWLSPAGADADFSEKLIRLPHGRLAYNAPPVAEPNVESARLTRFISLNRFSKCGDSVIDAWAAILRELPKWTLLLKAQGRDDDLVRHFHDRFAARGIDPSRVTIEGGGPYAEAMAAYHRGSIALDPFPFSGCSTSCDALWMGLPVITLPRATIASRQTAAWLQLAGKPEWIARDADDYVAKAVQLANDESGRVEWRRNAREILRPTVCDSERLARELIDALRAAANR
jgi:predicted O-linked N-acetylglucosamine transferase (SPINDLY family)